MRHFEPAQIEADFLSRLQEMGERDRSNARWLLENFNGLVERNMLAGNLTIWSYRDSIAKARQALKETQAEED